MGTGTVREPPQKGALIAILPRNDAKLQTEAIATGCTPAVDNLATHQHQHDDGKVQRDQAGRMRQKDIQLYRKMIGMLEWAGSGPQPQAGYAMLVMRVQVRRACMPGADAPRSSVARRCRERKTAVI